MIHLLPDPALSGRHPVYPIETPHPGHSIGATLRTVYAHDPHLPEAMLQLLSGLNHSVRPIRAIA